MIPLAEYLDNQYEAPISEDQRFVVDTVDKADWAVRKINRYRAEIEKAKAEATNQTEKINKWLAAVTEENQRQVDFFQSLLAPFADQRLTGEKKRSVKLPSGTIGFRKAGPKFEQDDKLLLPWAKSNTPDLVETVETVKWDELKKTITVKDGKAISPDGEIIPGITATERPDTFYVKGDE